MNRHQPLLLALAVIAMAVAGWNLGGSSGENPAASPLPANTRSARPERVVKNRPGPSGEAAQRLAVIRATANPSERMRATIDLANSLSPADFAAWLDGSWFTPRGGMEATVFTGILMERWRQEDPEGLLLWSQKNNSDAADSVVSAWAVAEPQRLLDFFKLHPDDRRELAALEEMAETHPELALRRLQEMIAAGISRDDDHYQFIILEAAAKQSPAALEAILDNLPDSLKSSAEEFLIGRKMQDAFANELRKLKERPDGFKLLLGICNQNSGLRGRLIDELKDLPAAWREGIASKASIFMRSNVYGEVSSDAAKWAAADLEGAGFTAAQATAIRAEAVSQLQSSEPETALKILAELDLPTDRRVSILESLFRNFSDKPEKAEALLALLGSEEDRQIARKASEATPLELEQVSKIDPIEQPAEWLATAAASDLDPETAAVYVRMIQSWEPEKVAALSAGFQSLPDEQKRNLSRHVLENYGSNDPPLQGEALAYLISLPAGTAFPVADPFSGEIIDVAQRSRMVATSYVVELGKENPEKAGGWIEALPDGEAKWYAARNLQSVWSLYDPAAAERWLKSLPAATREKVKGLK